VSRARMVHLAVAIAVVASTTLGAAASAGALGGASTTQCKGLDAKPLVHAAAVRREATLAALVAKLQARKDPFGMNGPQIATLQSASSAISALDATIQATCYPARAAFHTDASTLWTNYRVYWLRVPQSHAIEAADYLSEARTKLGNVATKLASLVGNNAQAKIDLEAMNTALASVDAQLGVAPTPGPSITAVRDLQPAADMTADDAAMQTAHTDLVAIHQNLVQARADGQQVISDLQG
jgi:hypothetical protein